MSQTQDSVSQPPGVDPGRVAVIALQAFASMVESNALPRDQVRVLFALLDGPWFMLDTSTRPALSQVPPTPETTASAPLAVLCNGAGLVGLMRNQLDGRPGQVFLARGDRGLLGRLAEVIDRVRQSPLDVRMGRYSSARGSAGDGSGRPGKRTRG